MHPPQLIPPWNLLASEHTLQSAQTLEVLSWNASETSIFGIVQSRSAPENYHSVSILGGKSHCSCMGSLHAIVCSHALALLMKVSETQDCMPFVRLLLDGIELTRESPYIPYSGLGNYDYLVGGIPVGALVGIFGTPKAGKSILATQMAWSFLLAEKNALLVDTEGGAGDFGFGEWLDAYNKRYETDVQEVRAEFDPDTASISLDGKPDKKNTFFVLDCRNIVDILKLHGFKGHLEVSEPEVKKKRICPICKDDYTRKTSYSKCARDGSELELVITTEGGGKLNFRYDPAVSPASMPAIELDIRKTSIGKLVEQNNIGYIQYDSITNPTEIYVSGQINFPGRDDVNGLWFQQIQSLTRRYTVTPSCIFHLSTNPTNPYDSYGHPIGGKSVGHNFKYTQLIRRLKGATGTPFSLKPEKVNTRNVYNMFHPHKGPFAATASLTLTEAGFVDSEVTYGDD